MTIKVMDGGLTGNPEKISEKAFESAEIGVENKNANQIAPVPVPKLASNVETISRANELNFASMVSGDPNYPKKAIYSIEAGILGGIRGSEKTDKGAPLSVSPGHKLTASRLTLSEATDNTNIVSTIGKYNFCPAAELKSDAVKLHGTRIVEIASGGQKYSGNSSKIMSTAGGVHIIAGNKASGGSYRLQKMVKGNNLVGCLTEMMTFINRTAEVQRAIVQDIMKLKLSLIAHIHIAPPVGPTSPSPDLAAAIGMSVPGGLMDIANNIGTSTNNELFKMNWLKPTSSKYILSRWNKVN